MKTTTFSERPGNMFLDANFQPIEFKPKCIHVSIRDWIAGRALNNVGLSGPGVQELLVRQRWQTVKQPFWLSFMSVAGNSAERIEDLKCFVDLLKRQLSYFRTTVGLQINFSCPNVGLDPSELSGEVEQALDIAELLNIPLMPKFNVLVPPEVVKRLSWHPAFSGVCISNTIPFGALPERIDWKEMYGSTRSNDSPLMKKTGGAGGLSGAPLMPLVIEWIKEARNRGFMKHINGGGGILSLDDALEVLDAGADSIFLGSIAFLRPWRVGKIIRIINAKQ